MKAVKWGIMLGVGLSVSVAVTTFLAGIRAYYDPINQVEIITTPPPASTITWFNL